jgi:hypothetical protein
VKLEGSNVAAKACLAIALMTALVASIVVLGASAAPSNTSDGNDTKGPLDIKRVEKLGNEKPRWTIVNFRDWRVERMWDHGYVIVNLDTFGSRRYDYYVVVRSKGTQLSATLWRDRARKDDVRIGFVESWKRNGRSVAVRIALRRLNIPKQRAFYYWQARTLYTGRDCTTVCIDVAPNKGGVQEPNPLFSPSPIPTTPVPTITPTITPSITSTPTPTPTG